MPVEIGGGLVEQQNPSSGRDGSSDLDELTLVRVELSDERVVGNIRGERGQGFFGGLSLGLWINQPRQPADSLTSEVLTHAPVIDQAQLLEHRRDTFANRLGRLGWSVAFSPEAHLTAVGLQYA